MRAAGLIDDSYPAIDVGAPAAQAARLIGSERRPALLVLDGDTPVTVLPGSQVLKFLIPGYLQDDPSLIGVYDERSADACAARLKGRTVGDLLPKDPAELPRVGPDATVLECAAVMAKLHSPLVVVMDREGAVSGVITASRLLDALVS
jgi:hypothetical protein